VRLRGNGRWAQPGSHYPGGVTIRLYDTSARQIRDFTPLQPGCVSIYLCGATVQAAPHIGHIRSGLNFDIMRRWFEYRGLEVTFIRNVTDIDDKIIAKSAEQNRPWWSIGYENERAFTDGYQVLGCLPPTYEPRATGHITEMVEMMRGLIERGHAYEADGNVYFAVTSFPDYLELSNQELENLLQPSGEGETGKRDPRDFAMWKAAKPGEPSWETPWGRGRPGWHLECSAMAHKYLGTAFDIHGGGLDLIFPHHENEIAQAKAYGDEFARYWVHNAWVTMSGEKMSKSLGNSVLVSEMVKRWRPLVGDNRGERSPDVWPPVGKFMRGQAEKQLFSGSVVLRSADGQFGADSVQKTQQRKLDEAPGAAIEKSLGNLLVDYSVRETSTLKQSQAVDEQGAFDFIIEAGEGFGGFIVVVGIIVVAGQNSQVEVRIEAVSPAPRLPSLICDQQKVGAHGGI